MTYTLEHIAGYEREKAELSRLCDIFCQREKHAEMGAKLPKGIIFYGPTGTGKTLFAKVLASVCNLRIRSIDIGAVTDETHLSRQLVRAFHRAAKNSEPTMIFFDEIDKVLPNDAEEYYTDQSKTILAQLLTLIDGLHTSGKVVFVATCNSYANLPDALVRPGRIDRKIEIGLPNESSRRQILQYYLDKTPCRFAMTAAEMAKASMGLSSAALETWVNECILFANDDGIVSEAVIRSKNLEIKTEGLPRQNPPLTDRIIACRNLGFFAVAHTLNHGDYTLNMEDGTVCNHYFDNLIGNLCDDDDDDDWDDAPCEVEKSDEKTEFYCKSDFLHAITVLYGGYAAQRQILGRTYANFGEREFCQIDDLLEGMAREGMLGVELRYSHNRHEYLLPYASAKLERVNAEFEKIELQCYEEAEKIIASQSEWIRKMIPILTESRELSKEKCEPILAELSLSEKQ